MAQEFPTVELPVEPVLSTIVGVAPNEPLRIAPNRALWKAQDSMLGQSRRILAEYHLQGSSSWAVPAGTVDPTGGSQVYPERNAWRTVAVHHALQAPGTKLECHCIYCPAGLTQRVQGANWFNTGPWARLRVRATWTNADSVSYSEDFELSMEGSEKGTWGGAENTAAGSDWYALREKVMENIMPPDFETDPEVGVLFSEWSRVRIELQVLGGERIVHAIVYEVPSVYTLEHDDDGLLSVHGAPPGNPEKPRRPQTERGPTSGTFEQNRWGTRAVLRANERQSARLGPRLMQWAANSHSGTDWDELGQVPLSVGASLTLANAFITSATGWAADRPGWIVAGSMAQLHRLNASNFMRGRAAVVPVRVIVDGLYTGSASTLRLQSSAYEWIDVALPSTRGEVVAYGYLASQVYGDHFAGILQPLITTPGGSGASIYNISIDFCEEDTVAAFNNIKVLAADVVNNNAVANTIADVTGLSFAVVAGATYKFRFVIKYDSAATTTGSRWSINGPAAPTALHYTSHYTITATTETTNSATAYDIPAASNLSSLTTGNIAIIEGFITPSVNGTVIARFASEVSSSAITARAGSTVEWSRVL
jgi:hypothetical protein